MAFLSPTIYVMSPKIQFSCEIEPLAKHADMTLGGPCPPAMGRAILRQHSVQEWCFPGACLSQKKEEKEAVVQKKNDLLLFSNASFTGSGWLVSTACPRPGGWSSHGEPSLELPDGLLCLVKGITSYHKNDFQKSAGISRLPI